MISGTAVAAAFAIAGPFASAQTTTTTTTTSTATKPRGTATPQMIQEACQRQRARFAKFQQFGTPERFGSEEPFKFDPSKPCS